MSVSIFVLLVMLRVLGDIWIGPSISIYLDFAPEEICRTGGHEGRNHSGLTSEISPLTKCNYNLPLPFSGIKYNP